MPELSSEREVLPSCIWTRPISRRSFRTAYQSASYARAMLRSQCFYGDFGALGFRKNGFPWARSGIFSKHIAPKSPAGAPQHKTNHSEKSFKTLQQAAKLCRRQDGSRLQISCNVGNQLQRRSSAAGGPYHPRAGSFRLRGMLMAAGGRAGWLTTNRISRQNAESCRGGVGLPAV